MLGSPPIYCSKNGSLCRFKRYIAKGLNSSKCFILDLIGYQFLSDRL